MWTRPPPLRHKSNHCASHDPGNTQEIRGPPPWRDHLLRQEWIREVHYEFQPPAGPYLRVREYIDKDDRQHINGTFSSVEKFLFPKGAVKPYQGHYAEAWAHARPQRIVLFRFLLKRSTQSIQERTIVIGTDLSKFRTLSKTLRHEVLHLMGCECMAVPLLCHSANKSIVRHQRLPAEDLCASDLARNGPFNDKRDCLDLWSVGYLARSKKVHLAPLNVDSIVFFVMCEFTTSPDTVAIATLHESGPST